MKTLYSTEIQSSKLEDIGTGQQRMAKERFDNAKIVIWNVKIMNQDKLNNVRTEISRSNINILQISKLKWLVMSHFTLEEHQIF